MSSRGGSARLAALGQLTLCRLREFVREPEAVFWVFVFPIILAVALGLAFREKAPDKIPVGVAAGPRAAEALAALGRSPVLAPEVYPAADGAFALRTGKVSLLVMPAAAAGGKTVFRFDETRPDSRIARLEAQDALERAAGRRDVLALESEKVTDVGARYIDFLIPGLLGMNLLGTGVWGLAFSVTTARNRRILKRLIATPMHRSDYLLSQILGRLIFLIPEVAILVLFGRLAFGVPMRGSYLLLAGICVLASMSFCGLGLLVAARVRTIEGASGLANLVLLPMWVGSGVFFSAERFPKAAQPVIHALPLTAVNDALRAVMLEGQGLAAVAPQLGIVAAWGAVTFAVALLLFRWK
jgi:ABC-2 type transport system permease protein